MSASESNAEFATIGKVYTPFKSVDKLPIQGTASTAKGTVALLPQYADGLADLSGFDRVWLIYRVPSEGMQMTVAPRLGGMPRGVFATRAAQHRPTNIGLTCVKLVRIETTALHVEGVDMLDGSDVIDIKPYVPRLDAHPDAWAGWLEHRFPGVRAWEDKKE